MPQRLYACCTLLKVSLETFCGCMHIPYIVHAVNPCVVIARVGQVSFYAVTMKETRGLKQGLCRAVMCWLVISMASWYRIGVGLT